MGGRDKTKMPTTLMKAIKPSRLNEAAMRQALEAEAKRTASDIELDFALTVSKWKRQPEFEKAVSVGPASVDILVGTDNLIYKFVSLGTKRHPIFAGIYTGKSQARALRFQSGPYTAITQPGLIGSRSGGPSGPFVYRAWVDHPGTEPRRFEQTIAKKWRKVFQARMERAMAQAARASGHSAK